MEEKDRTLGLRSVVSISVGLVIATSCLVSLGQGAGSIGVVFIGAMVIACLLNMTTVASLSELNALMPNTTGGLAQYTLACMGPFPTLISMVGGYLDLQYYVIRCRSLYFCLCYGDIPFHLPIPSLFVYLHCDSHCYDCQSYMVWICLQRSRIWWHFCWSGLWLIMGVIGMLGLGTGEMVHQPYSMATDFKDVVSMTAVAFWLFIGAEYVIPVSKDVKNAKTKCPAWHDDRTWP